MRAAVHLRGVIEITNVDPPAPQDSEVLVRVYAATVTAADYRFARALRYPLGRAFVFLRKKPLILGMELSGTVESVGRSVKRFRIGDEVFGWTRRFGAHAEFVCVPEAQLELKPSNMALNEAAAVAFGGLTALPFLRAVKIEPSQNVLVYGASGSVGVFAVQLAKDFGARVTGVCSTANLDLVRSLGADAVIDYTREDFSREGRVYDAVIDTVGKSGFSRTLRSLVRGGPYVRIAPSGGIRWTRLLLSLAGDNLRQTWISVTGAAKIFGGLPPIAPEDLSTLRELLQTGRLRTVIDRRFSLDQIAEAFRYAEGGHKKGHVLIEMTEQR